MRDAWYIFLAVAVLVAAFVVGAIAWCLIAYHEKRARAPERFTGNTLIEAIYVVIPLVTIAGLFIVTMRAEIPVDAAAPPGAVNRVGVTGFQWSWRFSYGRGFVAFGTPQEPPTLYLPVGHATELDLTSTDVTHSFWVPAFLFKRDAIPGTTNRFVITPTRLGTFAGRCAQFCGIDHTLMTFYVKVVPVRSYRQFIASDGVALP